MVNRVEKRFDNFNLFEHSGATSGSISMLKREEEVRFTSSERGLKWAGLGQGHCTYTCTHTCTQTPYLHTLHMCDLLVHTCIHIMQIILLYAVFPPEKNKREGVTMNILIYNYQYCFNT